MERKPEMKSQTCCFTGHREIPVKRRAEIAEKLEVAVRRLIEKENVRYFAAGGAIGFDTMAAQTVLRLKEEYPQIRLILVLPCKEQTEGWHERDKYIYQKILEKCDKFMYTSEHYFKGCMQLRNRHLVDNSAYCVAYCTRMAGGTVYTLRYAALKDLRILNLAESGDGEYTGA